ncbi:MAG TPA: YitT family protein [Acidobacteriota bacterium]|nr:YitT family protein [Acidobacteriota bacterium]
MKKADFVYSIIWNLLLLTLGSIIFAFGIKAIAVHHGFVTGGVFGTSLLLYYVVDAFSPNLWYFILNIPLFVFGYMFVSKRFFFYSLYAMCVITVAYQLIDVEFAVHNQLYAAIAAGVISGAGTGTILRSIGSAGGLDIIAIILNKNFNFGIGKFYFVYNAVLFTFTLVFLEADIVIASLILVFVSSVTVEYVLALFSQRKLLYIISDKNSEIAQTLLSKFRIGATFLKAQGAYSGREKTVLMTIVDSVRLKRVEEVVFTIDDRALFVVENTLGVIGSRFSRRKVY